MSMPSCVIKWGVSPSPNWLNLVDQCAPWAVVLYVALWPLPSLANWVLSGCACLMTVHLLISPSQGRQKLLDKSAWALSTVLFLGYWLPELASIQPPHAANIASKVVADVRYLPFMWFAAIAVNQPRRRQKTLILLAIIVAIWTIDGLLQWQASISPLFSALNHATKSIIGHDLCSPDRIAQADRLSGLWGPCHLKFGQVLVSLSPFLLVTAASYRRWLGLVAACALFVVLLLAGSRASWLSYALVILILVWHRIRLWQFAGGMLVIATLLFCVFITSWQVRERIARTTLFMDGNQISYDQALSGRLRIWKVAACIIETHPFRGVGVRRFRHVYSQCDSASARRAVWGSGPALHPHQILLEILTETGIVGLICWLAAVAMAWQAWRCSAHSARQAASAPTIALVATLFPINTHLAVYSSFWGGVTVLLAGLYVGMLIDRPVLTGNENPCQFNLLALQDA